MALLRTIVWFFYFFGSLVAVSPAMLRAKRCKEAGDEAAVRAIVDRYVPMWAGTLLRLAGVRVTVRGRENIPAGRAAVFTPNHQGNYDIPLMLTVLDRPHALVAKIETRKIPLVRTWMELFDCVFLDRESPRQAMAAMRQAAGLAQAGKSVIVFPEGTRSKGPEMGEFKAGAFKIACKAGVPIVPVAIEGSYRVMEANGGLMRPAHVTVTILPPVETQGLSRHEQHALAQQTAACIAQANAQARMAEEG